MNSVMKPVLILTVAIAGLATSSSVFARTEECHPTTEKEITALFDRWNASLQTGDPKKVIANYGEHSILLPTLSNQPRLTPEEKEDYFEHFLQKKPVGKIEFRDLELDCNTAVDTGLYTFTFGDGTQAKARYTFTYRWNGKQWLITSHHSSLLPEKE